MMKIAKTPLLTRVVGLLVLSLLILAALPGAASAGSLSQSFACKDGTSEIKLTTKKQTHPYVQVVCTSGSKIDYLLNGVEPTNQVTVKCPTGENVGSAVDTPNKPVSYIRYYCVRGGSTADAPTTRTTSIPKITDTTSKLDSGDSSDDVTDKTDPAVGSSVACTKDNCPLISRYVNPAIAVLSVLVGIVAVIAIVVGGIQVTTSAGDPQKSAVGKNHIRNAVIGVAAYVFLYAFLQWIIPGGAI